MISLIDINEAIQNNNHFFPNELITTALRNTGKSEIASNSLYSILIKNGLDNVSQETMYNALEDAKIRTIRFTAKNGYVGKKYNKEAIIKNMASFLYAIKKIHIRLGKSFPVLSYDKLPSVTGKNISQDKSEMEKASNELLKNDDVWYEGKIGRNVIFAEGQLAVLKELITEADSRLKAVDKIITAEFNNMLNLDDTVSDPIRYVNGNPNTTWREYLMYSLRHTFGLMQNSDVKYLPFVAKIAFSDEVGFEKRNNNGEEIQTLISIVNFIKKDAALFEKAKQCNSFEQLANVFQPMIDADAQAEQERINSKEYIANNDYEIIRINSFDEAAEIGAYSSDQEGGELCYTQSESTWKAYTKNGKYTVYCCLKKGWADMNPTPGKNAPYDEYGLSMIFVFIAPTGKIAYSNTRWNHEYTHNVNTDHAFTKEMLSDLLGVNFDKVFVYDNGNTFEEKVKEAKIKLSQGIDPSEIFDKQRHFSDAGFTMVMLDDMFSFIFNDNKLLKDGNLWFEDIHFCREKLIMVVKNGLGFAFLNCKGEFTLGDDFWLRDAFTIISDIKLSPYITAKGAMYGSDQICLIDINGHFIKNKNEILLIDSTSNDIKAHGWTRIESNGKQTFINAKGELIGNGDAWFDKISERFINGFTEVYNQGMSSLIDTNGKLIGDGTAWFDEIWFDEIWFDDNNGLFPVKLDNKWSLLDTNGKLIGNGNAWFNSICGTFMNGICLVSVDYGTYGFINRNGKLLDRTLFSIDYNIIDDEEIAKKIAEIVQSDEYQSRLSDSERQAILSYISGFMHESTVPKDKCVTLTEGQLARLKENIDNEDFRYHGRQMNFEPNTASKNADTTIFKSTQQNGVRRSKNDLNVDVRILPKSGVKCYNLYKIKNMSVNKTLKHGTNKFGDKIAWNHEGDKGIDYTHSIDWFIQRSIVYMKYIIGNQPVDVITYPQSSSTFNDMIARKLHAMFPQSQGIKLQPKLLIKNVRGMKVNVPMAKSLGLTDEEIMHLQQRVEVTWKQQEDIRDARRQMEALKKELEALLISRAHQKGRKPEKQIAYINQEIGLYDQLVKAKRKHMRGPDPTIDQDGNVKDWQIKILDDKIRRAIDNIFTLNPEMKNMASKLQGKSVVLFDDNLSSGATMDELCIALKQLGVANIIPITLGTIDPTIYQRSERLNRNNGKD